MEKNLEQQNLLPVNFVYPDIKREVDEIKRVAKIFGKENPKQFTEQFLELTKSSPLATLSEEMWSRLENTDSYDIPVGDWSLVKHHAVEGHPDSPRHWESYKSKFKFGESVGAPVVFKTGDTLHLVAGNTRLMVSRALGITPKVLLVEFV